MRSLFEGSAFYWTDSTVNLNGAGNTDWDCRDAENRGVGSKTAVGNKSVGSKGVENRDEENRDEESTAGGGNIDAENIAALESIVDLENIAVLENIVVAGSIPDYPHRNIRTLRLPTFPSLEPLPI